MNTFDQIAKFQPIVYATATEKGWWEKDLAWMAQDPFLKATVVLSKIGLMHSEVTEAFEAADDPMSIYLNDEGKPEGEAVELADVVIRVMDLAGSLGLDLAILRDFDDILDLGYPYGGRDVVHLHLSKALEFARKGEYDMKPGQAKGAALLHVTDCFPVRLVKAILACEKLCTERCRSDLWLAVAMKQEYNTKRTFRHGGKLA